MHSPRVAVDLDGTLVKTDLLWESALRYLHRSPAAIFEMVAWALRGPKTLKLELAKRVVLDAETLPYKNEVVDRLRSLQESGSTLVLATAAARPYAEAIAAHLKMFDGVLATDAGGPNLRSRDKAEAIDQHWNAGGWTYVGDSAKDIPVWHRASSALAVDLAPSTGRLVERLDLPVEHLRSERRAPLKVWLKQLRVHQWAKNALIFVPVLAAHRVLDPGAMSATLLAFASFSLLASAVYIWNDLSDIDDDRRHPTKSRRPLAAGDIRIRDGLIAAGVLFASSVLLGAMINLLFLAVLGVYFVATTLYSHLLKRRLVVDIVTLALLYTWRIVAGCAAIMVAPSIWLLAFSGFMFFSLATMKRYAEVDRHRDRSHGRKYAAQDMTWLLASGIGSGLVAVLVGVLYLDSDEVRERYLMPELLWATIPLLLYWVVRAWAITVRGAMHDDPVLFALRDRISLAVLGGVAAIALVATVVS